MTYYLRVGEVPAKRHTFHHDAAGCPLAEELLGQEGFAGSSSILYHRNSPSAVTGVEAATVERPMLSDNQPLLPWHLRAASLPAGGDLVTGRHVLLGNTTVHICWAAADRSSELYRNAAGDELVYLQSGRAVMESVFGRLEVAAGDYVVIPASTTHRWVCGDGPVEALILEAAGHVGIPARYRTSTGQLREGAPYCERDLRPPAGPLVADDAGPVPVLIRSRQGWSRHCHAHHPFDVVGWDGCAYPYAFSIHDFEPITGRIHQPPPVHQTFAGPGFVVCSFVARLLDSDPDAVKVPYHHANVDSDEVLFYSGGDFLSRSGAGIASGSLTLHPAGFVHGPQPGSVAASRHATRTDETAVMVDTFEPLRLSPDARAVADAAYPRSWCS